MVTPSPASRSPLVPCASSSPNVAMLSRDPKPQPEQAPCERKSVLRWRSTQGKDFLFLMKMLNN